ncbi:MAG: metal ABC transporter permease [Phycisphaerae bacterium]|nr:metal ABC transporter permease [Phycisphaerae bacterium]
MDDLVRLLTLRDANTRVVLLGATLLGIAAALVGTFAVLRKRSLMGDAVAHAALPGIACAYFVAGRSFVALLVGALVFGVLSAAFVSLVKATTRIKEDAAIALAIGGFFGLGVVLSRIAQNQPGGNRAGLDTFIYGKAASMVSADARLILAAAVVLALATALLHKEFKLLCFDRDFAATQGWPTLGLDLLLMGLVCVCTVVGLPAVGVVLMVALLIIPAAAARFWTDRLGPMLALAAGFGGASGMLGVALSAVVPAPASTLSRGWPTGPLIVLVAAGIFVASMIGAPRRGLVADLVRRVRLRRRVALQNLLRDAFERGEETGDPARPWTPRDLRRPVRGETLRRAVARGLARPGTAGFVLTPEGQAAAARVIRAHRLWELFLIEQAAIAPDHVDRDADEIEHVLPASVIAALEARLAAVDRDGPRETPIVPPSPHAPGATP